MNTWAQDQEKKRAAEKKKAKEAELREMELLFGKAVTAKGNKIMIDPKAKSKKGKTQFKIRKITLYFSANLCRRIRQIKRPEIQGCQGWQGRRQGYGRLD